MQLSHLMLLMRAVQAGDSDLAPSGSVPKFHFFVGEGNRERQILASTSLATPGAHFAVYNICAFEGSGPRQSTDSRY